MSLTPSAANNLIKKGINVKVEKSAGLLASIKDSDYEQIGAKIVQRDEAMNSDIILKVIAILGYL